MDHQQSTSRQTPAELAGFEAQVRSAMEHGENVQEAVRQLTLRNISAHAMNLDSLKQITEAVLRGVRAGAEVQMQQTAQQTEMARTNLKHAVSGLDTALAQFAQASKLAIQEATSKAQAFSNKDLLAARSDISGLESMFLETLQKSASQTKDAAGEIFTDLVNHARLHGSQVGQQLQDTLQVVSEQMAIAARAQVTAGLHLAEVTANLVRQIAAGVLTGLADHVKPGQPNKEG